MIKLNVEANEITLLIVNIYKIQIFNLFIITYIKLKKSFLHVIKKQNLKYNIF